MKFFRFLASRGFAVFLLVISTALLIIWNKYHGIYHPLFLVIPAFLFISISFCVGRRAAAADARRNVRFLGSMIFHTGMLVIIASASLSHLTRFFAAVVLPQGMQVGFDNKNFSTIYEEPLGLKDRPFVNLRLDNYEAVYADERFPVKYSSDISIGIMEDNAYHTVKERIEINRPFHYNGYTLLLETARYSPRFILRDREGKALFDGFINLANMTENEDVFSIKEAGLTLYTRFFPDMFREGNKVGTRSPVLKNPAFGIKIVKRDNPFADIWKGVLKKGEAARFEDMTLEFADLKPYVVIQIVKDPTYWGIFTGWIFIIVGLVIRYAPVAQERMKVSSDTHGEGI
ncbi:MAG: cytochrome c biogenesis protein ResB [Deltaproteobacteria bacterium]|nr:cytochrome c biogenesis protein ResB [Deltaproteobacteria bacterium]